MFSLRDLRFAFPFFDEVDEVKLWNKRKLLHFSRLFVKPCSSKMIRVKLRRPAKSSFFLVSEVMVYYMSHIGA